MLLPYRSLEEVDVLVNAEVETIADPILCLLKLVRKTHDVHRVQGVDEGEAEPEPVLTGISYMLAAVQTCFGDSAELICYSKRYLVRRVRNETFINELF